MTRTARILRFGPVHRRRRLLPEALPEAGEDTALHAAPAAEASGAGVLITDANKDRAEALKTRSLDADAAAALIADLDVNAIAARHRDPARLVETVRAALAIAGSFEAGHGTVFVLNVPSPLVMHTAEGSGRTLH